MLVHVEERKTQIDLHPVPHCGAGHDPQRGRPRLWFHGTSRFMEWKSDGAHFYCAAPVFVAVAFGWPLGLHRGTSVSFFTEMPGETGGMNSLFHDSSAADVAFAGLVG